MEDKVNTRRILTVRSEFGQNGPGTQSLEIAKEMKKRGHYVIFASNGGVMKSEIEKDFTHYTIPTLKITKRDPVSTMKTIRKIRNIIKKEKINTIHAHNAAAAYCAYLASRGLRWKVQITHSVRGMELRPKYQWRNWIYRLYPATFFAVSGFTEKMLLDVGVKSEKIIKTYNGVDISKFDPSKHDGKTIRDEIGISDDVLLIGQVGAFTTNQCGSKGQSVLIEAFADLKKRHNNIALAFVGDGDGLDLCIKKANDLMISDSVFFLGYRRDIPDFQAATNISVLASVVGEMFPNALLEAMAMGNPWVSTILSGIPEMAEDGQCGLLAKPGDAKDLADKIEELIVNKNKRLEMGKNCFDTVREKYTIVKICDKIENCYQ